MCFSLWKISLCQLCWLLLVLSSARDVCCYSQPDLTASTHTTATTTASTLSSIRAPDTLQFTAANVVELKDTLSKRNVKVDADLSTSSSAKAKSYDPPPEFYRGPGSTVAGSSSAASSSAAGSGAYSGNAYGNRDSLSTGYGTKPFSFPDNEARHKYGTNSGTNLANEYNSWQLLRGGNLRDRISVGHYGSANHGTAHAASGYAYEGRPYVESQHSDYGGGYYAGTAPGGGAGGAGGYYGGTGDGIRFDVYGTKAHGAGSGSGSSHYDGSGGEYSYTYPELHESPGHGHSKEKAEHKALLAKSFLIPLASAAVLGIAAALVSNPLLLQLGTVSAGGLVPVVGKRKRRAAVSRNAEASEQADTLAYRTYRPSSSLARI